MTVIDLLMKTAPFLEYRGITGLSAIFIAGMACLWVTLPLAIWGILGKLYEIADELQRLSPSITVETSKTKLSKKRYILPLVVALISGMIMVICFIITTQH